ncbi:alpha-L-fucosidase [Paenibacillus sacheonensis]|uniref:alpha-L-fucosidase n=1 Tax=Paenibacillus sacheonensis TaxID=742054 RepID=A0A7X5C1K7_9BACL|nr:alpha-L-fucosidase [Paenibacillus sacheonensis]MBM7567248.1 alpha-L-fucosidase [Paenibacillus sacheonensis]NBC72857.1 alpha-L-fucosidase [Paenibacillus sacheonensis]
MSGNEIECRKERTKWFLEDRFGMFIHWGLYAIPARGEWVRSVEHISSEDYQVYFDEFNPDRYDAREWARTAKAAGMKYAVLTAKHHDGFCLFDSKLTDYKSTNTQSGRDLVREFVDAFRAEGLKVGLYYSLLDWHHPDYPAFGDLIHPMRANENYRRDPARFEHYLDYMHGQVRELLTNYGKLDIMWFDFSYENLKGEAWRATELMEMIRSIQPHLIIDNRLEASGEEGGSIYTNNPSPYAGDFASPEQIIPPNGVTDAAGNSIPWEACMTLNNNWGYASTDRTYKSAKTVIRKLVECVSKNGNLLLNVGPDAKGEMPRKTLEVLEQVGDWMTQNGDSIYGCGQADFPKPEWGRYTQKGNKLFAHVFEDSVGPVNLVGLADKVRYARLLADGSEVSSTRPWNAKMYPNDAFINFASPEHFSWPLPDERDTVVEVTLKSVEG